MRARALLAALATRLATSRTADILQAALYAALHWLPAASFLALA